MTQTQSNLEESLRTLVSPERATDAFESVRYRFQTDGHLFNYVSQELQQKGLSISPHGVMGSLSGRQKKIRLGLEAVTLKLDAMLKGEEGVVVHSDFFLPIDRREAPRIFQEVRDLTQPMMDWYPFESKKGIARFMAEELCDIKWGRANKGGLQILRKKFNMIMDMMGTYQYPTITNEKIAVYQLMQVMINAANLHYLKWSEGYQPYKPTTGILPKTQSLQSFVDESIKKLLGKKDANTAEYVSQGLREFKGSGQISQLVEKLMKSYKFPSRRSFIKFLLGSAGKTTTPDSKEGSGIGLPNNADRKIYSIALILDYAAQNKLEVNISNSLFFVDRRAYMREIKRLKQTALRGEALAYVLGCVMGVNEKNARDQYSNGSRSSMRLDYYSRLCEFNDKTLPNLSFVDITEPRGMQREVDRFRAMNKGGRVLVIAGRIFSHRGNVSPEYVAVLNEIREHVKSMGGLPFLFPTFSGTTPQVSGYLHYKELLTGTKYRGF